LPLLVEKQISHLVANRDDLHLIIRPHPNENRIVAEGDNVSVSDSNEPLHPILHAVNVVVVLTSTVGLEAAISGTPVITVDNSVFTQDAPYSKYGISRGINNLNELESAIDQAIRMQDVNRKHQIAQSTNNVCDEIIALLEKNR
jgi:predicted glycosyltransferase